MKNKELVKLCKLKCNELINEYNELDNEIFQLKISINNMRSELSFLDVLIGNYLKKMSREERKNLHKFIKLSNEQDCENNKENRIRVYDEVDLHDVPNVKLKKIGG